MFTRRILLTGAAVTAAGAAVITAGIKWRRAYTRRLAPPLKLTPGKTNPLNLVAMERSTTLPCFAGHALPMWTFAEGVWPPVIRLKLGERLNVVLQNKLPRPDESTSIHWHGCRLPNNQDGVPYLVQKPVMPGESFLYNFMPPDTGTFFFHTHCDTTEQAGRGLQGVLIVEGDTTEPYDADVVLFLRDWQVDLETGEFNPFFTLRGAGRAGTYAPVRSVNGTTNPDIMLPAGGDCRLRLINGDPTRIMVISVEDAEAAIIAIDGFAIEPVPLSSWSFGPAMRMDLVIRAPEAGKKARLIDSSESGHVELANFIGQGKSLAQSDFDPAPLHAVRIAEPNLDNANRLSLIFDRTDTGQFAAVDEKSGVLIGPLCLNSRSFWSINGTSWPDKDHATLPPPFAVLDRGQSYIFTLKNNSDFSHPIHIHGHTFKLVSSDKVDRPADLHTDTLLLVPGETAEVAFVADNPGNWMLHCHIIEHQETGMMTYFLVA